MSGSLNSLLPDPLSPLQPAASPLVKAPDSYDTADAYVSTKNALTDWVADQRAQSSAMGLWDDQTGLPTAAGVKNALLSIGLGTNSSGGGVAARSAGGRQGELALEAPAVAPVAAPAAVAEAGPRSDVVAHGTLYHGTREPLSAFQPGETYMTSSPENAAGYAGGGHLGGSGDGPPQVLSVATTPGRTLDINQAIMDEVFSNDGDFGDAINAEIAKARPAGYRYLTYEHPSFDGGADHPVVISLHPHEDLAMSGLAGDAAASGAGGQQ